MGIMERSDFLLEPKVDDPVSIGIIIPAWQYEYINILNKNIVPSYNSMNQNLFGALFGVALLFTIGYISHYAAAKISSIQNDENGNPTWVYRHGWVYQEANKTGAGAAGAPSQGEAKPLVGGAPSQGGGKQQQQPQPQQLARPQGGAPSQGGAKPLVGGAPSQGGAKPLVGGAPSQGGGKQQQQPQQLARAQGGAPSQGGAKPLVGGAPSQGGGKQQQQPQQLARPQGGAPSQGG